MSTEGERATVLAAIVEGAKDLGRVIAVVVALWMFFDNQQQKDAAAARMVEAAISACITGIPAD